MIARNIRRGLRIAVSALFGRKRNALLPFVTRALRMRWPLFAASMLAAILADPVGLRVYVRFVLSRPSFWDLTDLSMLSYVRHSFPANLIYVPFCTSFLIAVVGGFMTRRWMQSPTFQRDMRSIPGAAVPLAAAFAGIVASVVVACYLATEAIRASNAVISAYYAFMPHSYHAQYCMEAGMRQAPKGPPVNVAVLSEIVVRLAEILHRVALACTCFTVVTVARRFAVGVAAAFALNVADAALGSATVWFAVVKFSPDRVWRGTPRYDTFADAVPRLIGDFAMRPALALLWACVACWAVSFLADRIASILGPQEAAGA